MFSTEQVPATKNGFMLFYSDMSNMAACSACITEILVKNSNVEEKNKTQEGDKFY